MDPLLQGLKLDNRTALQLAAAACGAGALAVLLRTVSRRRAARDKIQRARTRRTESLQRAERELQRYRRAVRTRVALRSNEITSEPRDLIDTRWIKVHTGLGNPGFLIRFITDVRNTT